MGCTVEISITKAASDWKVSRTTIHKKIKSGQLTKQSNGTIDTSEMFRVFGEPPKVKVHNENFTKVVSELHPEIVRLQSKIQHLESDLWSQKELARKGEEREAWLQNQVGNLTDTIKLLDAPKAPKKRTWLTWVLAVLCLVLAISLAALAAFMLQR
jgi:hypothetical protein